MSAWKAYRFDPVWQVLCLLQISFLNAKLRVGGKKREDKRQACRIHCNIILIAFYIIYQLAHCIDLTHIYIYI